MVILLCVLGVPARCPAQSPDQPLQEIVVVGERAGPGLWRVHRGAANVWILGTVSPLPKDMTWQSAQVERVIGDCREVLVAKPFSLGVARALWLLFTQRDLFMIHGGRKLHDVLPVPLYVRFAAQRARLTGDAGKWERYRPLIASAFLEDAAIRKVGLSNRLDLDDEVRKLARKHAVPLDEIRIAGVHDALDVLKSLPPQTEDTCMAAALGTVESGLPSLAARADAWARGDVEAIERLGESPETMACWNALNLGGSALDLITQIERTWLASIEQHLSGGGNTFAVMPIDMLLQHGGMIDALRSDGFEVEAP
jgi:uncharacterized protein YbaP (TraB family)